MNKDIEKLVFYVNEKKRLQKLLEYCIIEEIDGDAEKYELYIKDLDQEYGYLREKYPEYFI